MRAYAPLSDVEAGDAGIGLDWRPRRDMPIHFVVERREAFGAGGRSAFSAFAYAGASYPAPQGGRIDLYGQTGIVGARSRDAFADGVAIASWSLGGRGDTFRLGAGIWAAAQPGVSRVDIGPHISVRPRADTPLAVSLDWRQRVAGNAAPASGPALTLSAGF
ncbi:hypothetical protein [Allosphingosinicella vermicomposti]|uniref:hypothetical protein n=1 Tax=Allosphingosinicella vermicomposti TaxID=614671 RepID=UPI00131A4BB2|nr:hypothetical protein [Allosphingosinicella vermicomposti]